MTGGAARRTLFVSDVHLNASRPQRVAAFLDLLRGEARQADALYLLGDVFDEWLGDDDARPPHPEVERGLRELSASGVPVRVMHGNHDFLLGGAFAERTGCALLQEPSVADVYGVPVLLMHGDTLCTDDVEYQRYRAWTRDPDTQRAFLALPLAERAERAAGLRSRSRVLSRLKPADIMDVAPAAVTRVFREHAVRHIVHGHTHRPAIHVPLVDGEPCTRIVLGDWYEQDSMLVWEPGGRLRLAGGTTPDAHTVARRHAS